LRLILSRVWQRPFMLEHLAKITAVNPAIAGRTADEMPGLTNRRLAELLPQISAARKADH
jgi:hypothetical protein